MAKIKRLNDKQRSAKYYTEYKKWSRTDFTKNGGEIRKDRQFLLHMWHPSCQSCYKPGDKKRTRKGPDYNIRGHLWYIYSVTVNSSWWIHDEFNLTHMNLWFSSFLVRTDHLTCRVGKGGGYGFLFRPEFFFRTRELEYLFFLSRILIPECNIKLYDKNSESDYFIFPPPKWEYFFQQRWESEYFFRKIP
jgi:hypothetical protein